MRKLLFLCLVFIFSLTLSAQQETGHYVDGVEGIKVGSVPGPGFYYKMYNAFYTSNKLMDGNGDKMGVDFDLTVYANVHRFVWITKKKFLGADYGMNTIIPLVYTDISIGAFGLAENKFALSDVTLEPLVLAWHKKQLDLAFAAGAVVPIGQYDVTNPASAGKDMWTGMITAGATYYFDTNKSWALSALTRYETHSEKGSYAVSPGDDFHFEWGLSKTLPKKNAIWDLGIAGYAWWQISDDKGADVDYDASVHDRHFAIGPEVAVFLPKQMMSLSIRSQKEFGVIDRAKGSMSCLSLVKVF